MPWNLRAQEYQDAFGQQTQKYLDGKQTWDQMYPATQKAVQDIIDQGLDLRPVQARHAGSLQILATPFYRRDRLPLETPIPGPAIILQTDSTTVVPSDATVLADHACNLILRREVQWMDETIDSITASVVQGALENIAVEMGYKLMRMSYSSIIRESEDLGAGIFDAQGRELCESDSTPMHIGSLPWYIRGFLDLLTIMFIGRFRSRPMHLFGGLGLLFCAIGVVIGFPLLTGLALQYMTSARSVVKLDPGLELPGGEPLAEALAALGPGHPARLEACTAGAHHLGPQRPDLRRRDRH